MPTHSIDEYLDKGALKFKLNGDEFTIKDLSLETFRAVDDPTQSAEHASITDLVQDILKFNGVTGITLGVKAAQFVLSSVLQHLFKREDDVPSGEAVSEEIREVISTGHEPSQESQDSTAGPTGR